ncbi:MAG: VOC family protein, partial [Verrucomicrobiales bacterium]
MKTLITTFLALGLFTHALRGEESAFATPTIDLGLVVSDIEKAVAFYTKAIGFTEVPGFQVPADFAKDAGLTDSKKLKIRVLTLGEGGTKLKL